MEEASEDGRLDRLQKIAMALKSGGLSLIIPGNESSFNREIPENSRRYKIARALKTGGLSLVFDKSLPEETDYSEEI